MSELFLSQDLHAYLDGYCARRHADDSCPLKRCSHEGDCQSSRRSLELISTFEGNDGFNRLRQSFRDVECEQCLVVLILQALQRLMPDGSRLGWLDSRNFDLAGRTPRECLEERKFLPVVDALWKSVGQDYTCS
jgi:hypothetical protein